MTEAASFSVKDDGSLLSTADLRSNEAVLASLADSLPGVPVHSEESHYAGWLTAGCILAVDPLDGTTNYTRGIPLFCVSIGLLEDGVPRAGAIATIGGDIYYACRGRGSYHAADEHDIGAARRLACARRPLAEAIFNISTDQSDAGGRRTWWRWLDALRPPTCFRLRNIETAAIELCWLSMGRIDGYLHPKDKVWDLAAGALIAREAGAVVMTPHLREWTAADQGVVALSPSLVEPVSKILADRSASP